MIGDKDNEVDKSRLVLFVDDEIEILNSIKRQISFQDEFHGIFESNPTKVMSILDRETVEIIVADIVMPELDGITLLTQIKEKYPHIVRIMLTAHGDYNTSIRAINEADVFGFITKPWDKGYLFGHLLMASKVVDRQKQPIADFSDDLITTMISYWDDIEGSEILYSTPKGVGLNLDEIASRCFMSSTGIFGHGNRFNKNTYTMPLNEIKMNARLYLDNEGGKPFGIFIIAKEIPSGIEQQLDEILQKYGTSFSTGTAAETITDQIIEEISPIFEKI